MVAIMPERCPICACLESPWVCAGIAMLLDSWRDKVGVGVGKTYSPVVRAKTN